MNSNTNRISTCILLPAVNSWVWKCFCIIFFLILSAGTVVQAQFNGSGVGRAESGNYPIGSFDLRVSSTSKFTGGSGRGDASVVSSTVYAVSPTLIYTWQDLHNMRNNLFGNYVLMNNLGPEDVGYATFAGPTANTNQGWDPVANFQGSFNGNGFVIRGLTINRSATTDVGLFGSTANNAEVVIQNLGLVDVFIVGQSRVGAILGYANNTALTMERVFSTGSIRSISGATGGLVGHSFNRIIIRDAYSLASVSVINSNADYAGGLIGWISSGIQELTRVYSAGIVGGRVTYGGLVGFTSDSPTLTVTSSYWDVNASGNLNSAAGTARSTTQMRSQATFTGWDFSTIWQMTEGQTYPHFRSPYPTLSPAPGSVPSPASLTATSVASVTSSAATASAVASGEGIFQRGFVLLEGTSGEPALNDTSAQVFINPNWNEVMFHLGRPASPPTSSSNQLNWSPDGQYLSVPMSSTPFLALYKRDGNQLVRLPAPDVNPTSFSSHTSWSPDGVYLTVSHSASPFITIYKRSGDTFTKLSNPGTLPTNVALTSAWSPDGIYLTVGHQQSPFITIYKRSGDTFTKLPNPATLPNPTINTTATVQGVAWSSDGDYLSVAHSISPFLTIYRRNGDTFDKVPNPATLPPAAGLHTEWTPDGLYLSITHNTWPFISIYKRSGHTFTKISGPTISGNATQIQTARWSPDGTYLIPNHLNWFLWFFIEKRTGDNFADLDNNTNGAFIVDNTSITGSPSVQGMAWSPDGQLLAITTNEAPFISVYSLNPTAGTGGTFTTSLTNLKPMQDYRLRSFVRNASGISYGPTISFSTPAIEIRTWAELRSIRDNLTGRFRLMNNLGPSDTQYSNWAGPNANSNAGWEPIGNSTYAFDGTFDGQGFTLSGINLNRSTTENGLFGITSSAAVVQNLRLQNARFTSTVANLGVIAGNHGGLISNVTVLNPVISGQNQVGAFVGTNLATGRITQSAVEGLDLRGSNDAGGLVGLNQGTISRSYALGQLIGTTARAGGIVGENRGTISDVYSVVNVTGATFTGGLVGNQTSVGLLQRSYSAANVLSTGASTGAILGTNAGTANSVFFNSTLSGLSAASGGGAGTTTATALSLSQMRTSASFSTFDFTSVWQLQETTTFPYFRSPAIVQDPPPGFANLPVVTGTAASNFFYDRFTGSAQASGTGITRRGFVLIPGSVGEPELSTPGALNRPNFPWNDTFTRVVDPATMPTNSTYTANWSPDGTYLAVGQTSGLNIYKRNGDNLLLLAAPSPVPAGTVLDASWSPDGTYLSIAHNSSPFISIYKRSGDTFTRLSNPNVIPTATARGTAWSPDGNFMATTTDAGAPGFFIYRRTGDSFTKLPDPAVTLSAGTSVAWSPDGTYFTVTSSSAPFLIHYKQVGETFVKLDDPNIMPTVYAYRAAWSPDGAYLAVGINQSSGLWIYKRNGDQLLRVAQTGPSVLQAISWSPDGDFIAAGGSDIYNLYVINRTGDSFNWIGLTKLAQADLPTSVVNAASWSPDGRYLSVAFSSRFNVYKRGGDAFSTESFDKIILGLEPLRPYRMRAYAENAGGIGYGPTITVTTAANEIRTWQDLHNMRNDLSATYVLMNNLGPTDPGYQQFAGPQANSNLGWTPVGPNTTNPFRGLLMGNGFTIDGLTINQNTLDNAGLFGVVGTNGTVDNLALANLSIWARSVTGGVAGNNRGGLIRRVYVSGSVRGNGQVGGIVGRNDLGGVVHDVYSLTSVQGSSSVGGVIGYHATNSYLARSYAAGLVSGSGLGGLVGSVDGSSSVISSSYWHTRFTGQSTSAGGGEGLSNFNMKRQVRFLNWDFQNIWQIQENRSFPYFRAPYPVQNPNPGLVNLPTVGSTTTTYTSRSSFDASSTASGTDMVRRGFVLDDKSSGDLLVGTPGNRVVQQFPWTETFSRLGNPATLPASTSNTGYAAHYSPDGTHLVIATSGTPFLTFYSRIEDVLTKLPDPELITGWAYDVKFSPDGELLAVAHNTAPFLTVYKRSGDSYVKLATPANPPTVAVRRLDWTTDGQYLALGMNNAPAFILFKRSGDVLTRLAGPSDSDMPSGASVAVAWSPDGRTLLATQSTSPYLRLYRREGDAFTLLPNPATLPLSSGTGNFWDAAWSPDGRYVAIGHGTAPFIAVYEQVGEALVRLSDPVSQPAGFVYGLGWSPDGRYLTVGHATTPFFSTYRVDGQTLTKLADLATGDRPASTGFDAVYSPDGRYLTIPHSTSPFFTVYRRGEAFHSNGSFQLTFRNMDPEQTYRVRSYAENESGVAYGPIQTVEPYYVPITTWQELHNIRLNLNQPYRLMNDLGPSTAGYGTVAGPTANGGLGWEPIDNFSGILDGNGHVIDGLFINRTTDNEGLFGLMNSTSITPVIKNLGLTNVNITTTTDFVGAFIGRVQAVGTLRMDRVFSTGTINGRSRVGGLIGNSSRNVFIANAYSTAALSISSYALGGLIGEIEVATGAVGAQVRLTNAYAANLISGVNSLRGGLLGNIVGPITLVATNSYWDIPESGLTTTQTGGGTGLPTSEMMQASSFTGWDFSTIWQIQSGMSYPYFREPYAVQSPAPTSAFVSPPQVSSVSISNLNSNGFDAAATATGSGIYRRGFVRVTGNSGDPVLETPGALINQESFLNQSFTKLRDASPGVGHVTYDVSWSPDGTYLGVNFYNNNLTVLKKIRADYFIKLPFDYSLLSNSSGEIDWSPDGQYMAFVDQQFLIFKRSGDTFTKLTDPAVLPAGRGWGLNWSPDGTYLAVAHNTTPFITIYKRNGDTFTKLANPATLPPAAANSVSWTPDGNYLTVGHETSPFITTYRRSGDTFTKIDNPAVLPTSTVSSVEWSPDGVHLAVHTTTSPRLLVYKRSGEVLTQLSGLPALFTATGNSIYSISWSPNGRYLTVSHVQSPYLTTLERNGDTFTKLPDLSNLPTTIYSVEWSNDSRYLAIGHSGSGYTSIYQVGVSSNGAGSFSTSYTDLPVLTDYRVRAFAQNDAGIVYSPTVGVTTPVEEVRTWQDLHNMRNKPRGGFRLMNNLGPNDPGYALYAGPAANSGTGWLPVGTVAEPFLGYFDGGGFTLKGLTINRPSERQGFFGVLGSTADVTNLVLEDVNITTGSTYVGALAGEALGADISRVLVTGSISARGFAGGVVGNLSGGSISVTAAKVTLTLSPPSGPGVFIQGPGGGIAGSLQNNAILSNSYSLGTISVSGSGSEIGGVVGSLTGSQLQHTYAAGPINQPVGLAPGGVVGAAYSTFSVTQSYWDSQRTTIATSSQGVSRTTAQLTGNQASTQLTGFNFGTTWTVLQADSPLSTFTPKYSGYPLLQGLDLMKQYLLQVRPMVVVVNTAAPGASGTTVTLPLRGATDLVIDWGDGNTSSVSNANQTTDFNYTYAAPGTYTISISGVLAQFGSGSVSYANANKLIQVTDFGELGITSLAGAFYNATNLTTVPATLPVTVTNTSYLFYGASSFNQAIGDWDVSRVTNMHSMFMRASSFNQAIGNWNVGNVTQMTGMFREATAFNQSIGSWDVADVTQFQQMFHSATSFNQPIGTWNMGSAISMDNMFQSATSFNQDISTWNVGSVNSMQDMFNGATAFNQNLSTWNVSAVTNMIRMFFNVTLSPVNYSALLVGWSQRTLQPNVVFHGGNSRYYLGAPAEARQKLRNPVASGGFNWTVTDGGPVLPDQAVWSHPVSVIVNEPFTVMLELLLEGSPYPLNSPVTLEKLSGSGTLSGTLSVTATNGVVLFQNLRLNAFGGHTLRASLTYLDGNNLQATYQTDANEPVVVTSHYVGGMGRGDISMQTDLITLNGEELFVWIGGTPGQERNWFTPSNWSQNELPQEGSFIRINSSATPPLISGLSPASDVQFAGNLTVADQASLTLVAGPVLTLTSDAVVTTEGSGKLILEPGAVYLNQSASEPTLEVQQLVTGEKGWRMLGSPLKGITYSNLLTGLVPQGFGGVTSPLSGLQPNVLWFDETDGGTTLQSWRKPTHVGNTVTLGRGHYVYVFDGATIPGGSGTTYADALPVTLRATGKEHNFLTDGSVNFGVSYSPRNSPLQQPDAGQGLYIETSPADAGFNMVANPTASVIDFYQSGAWTKTNLDNSIYVWDPSMNSHSGGWRTFNGITGNLQNGRIAPYQAFWVRANAANPVLRLNSGQAKSTLTKSYYSRFSETEPAMKNSEVLTLSLQVSGEGMVAESWISFDPEGKPGQDLKDAYQLESLSDNWLLLYSYGSQNHRTPLQINNQDYLSEKEKSIPLMLAAAKSEKEFSGKYKLSWKVPDFWPEDVALILMDHTREQAIDMREQENYDFSFEAPKMPGARVNLLRSGMKSPGPVIFDSPFESGDPNSRTTRPDLSKRPFTIRIGSYVEGKEPEYLPDYPRLFAPVPNPFSREVKIRFYLPYAMTAQVIITDVSGRVVQDFGPKSYEAGVQELGFTDVADLLVPGFYTIQLLTRDHLLNQKLIKLN